MAITVPATGDQISATTFGKPVADWINRKAYFRYTKTATQQSVTGQNTITYPTRVSDSQSLFNGSQFTCPAALAGLWIFNASIHNSVVWSDGLNLNIVLNDVGITWTQYPASGAVPISAASTAIVNMVAGDIVKATCYTNTPVVIGGTWTSFFTGALV